MGEGAHVARAALEEGQHVGQRVLRRAFDACELALEGANAHDGRGQLLGRRIVQFLGDAPPLLLLGLEEAGRQFAQLILGPPARRDVLEVGDEEQWPPLVVAQQMGARDAPHRPAVLAQVALLEREALGAAVEGAPHAVLARRPVVGVRDVEEVHAPEVVQVVSEEVGEGMVDAQEAAAGGREAHAHGACIEHRAEALLAAVQGGLGPLALALGLRVPKLALDGWEEAREAVPHHEILGARLHQGRGLIRADVAGDDQEGGVEPRLLQEGERRGRAEARQRVVAQHDVPLLLPEGRPQAGLGLHPLRRGLVAAAAQLAQQQLGIVLGVLDQQHAERRAHPILSPRRGLPQGGLATPTGFEPVFQA